jgi:hypothetical protein
VSAYARPGGNRQQHVAAIAPGGSAEYVARLAIVRPSTVISAELMGIIAAWRLGRLERGSLGTCAACGEVALDPAAALDAIAALVAILEPTIELAGICRWCATGDDEWLFDIVLSKRGETAIDPASLASESGSA